MPSFRARPWLLTGLLFHCILWVAACPNTGSGNADDVPRADAGVTDAGPARDAAPAVDAGNAPDAGRSPDAGNALDAGRSVDAGNTVDAGNGADEKRVFTTSLKYTGNLGGLAGADTECQALANAAALGATWLAWLGDGTDGPMTRFNHATTPYRVVGGGLAAQDWADLIDGTLGVPLNHDETGTPLPQDDDMIVWTAVFHTGGNTTPVHCSGWTSAAQTLVPTGLANATDTGWTVFAPHNCNEMHRLYCFEQ